MAESAIVYPIKQNTTLPPFIVALTDPPNLDDPTADPPPTDLTLATVVTLSMATLDGEAVFTQRPMAVDDAANGVVRYDWQPADTAEPGLYLAEIEVFFPGGASLGFPSDGQFFIRVVPQAIQP